MTLVEQVLSLHEQNKVDDAIDLIIETIDDLYDEQKFDNVNKLLEETNLEQLPNTYIFTHAMCGSWAKEKLPIWPEFIKKCWDTVVARDGRARAARLFFGFEEINKF